MESLIQLTIYVWFHFECSTRLNCVPFFVRRGLLGVWPIALQHYHHGWRRQKSPDYTSTWERGCESTRYTTKINKSSFDRHRNKTIQTFSMTQKPWEFDSAHSPFVFHSIDSWADVFRWDWCGWSGAGCEWFQADSHHLHPRSQRRTRTLRHPAPGEGVRWRPLKNTRRNHRSMLEQIVCCKGLSIEQRQPSLICSGFFCPLRRAFILPCLLFADHDGVEAVRHNPLRSAFVPDMVHGFRCGTYVHVSLLASASKVNMACVFRQMPFHFQLLLLSSGNSSLWLHAFERECQFCCFNKPAQTWMPSCLFLNSP